MSQSLIREDLVRFTVSQSCLYCFTSYPFKHSSRETVQVYSGIRNVVVRGLTMVHKGEAEWTHPSDRKETPLVTR